MTVVGTRPEIIRLSEVIKKLDLYCDHIFVHTGQNYDYELNQIFFEDLTLRKPDYFLEVKSARIGEQIGKIISGIEKVIIKENPDAFLILGDTNSALTAIAAKRYKIPVFHMEAGNRCFDENTPEELNRRIVDHISNINFCYTQHAKLHLIREGLNPGNIYITGTPMTEVIKKNYDRILKSDILKKLKLEKKKYFVLSAHREENVDNENQLKELIISVNHVVNKYKHKIIFSTHPRTLNRLKYQKIKFNKNVIINKPFGFFDYVNLQKNAFCVISDSGTIFEESAILEFPAVVIRNSTERPEALDTGVCVQCGIDSKNIENAVEIAVKDKNSEYGIPNDYKSDNVSSRVVRFICGQAKIIKMKTWGNF